MARLRSASPGQAPCVRHAAGTAGRGRHGLDQGVVPCNLAVCAGQPLRYWERCQALLAGTASIQSIVVPPEQGPAPRRSMRSEFVGHERLLDAVAAGVEPAGGAVPGWRA